MKITIEYEASNLDEAKELLGVDYADELAYVKKQLLESQERELALRNKMIAVGQTFVSGKELELSLSALINHIKNAAKIGAIKEVRTITGMGLKECKELVEDAAGLIYFHHSNVPK